MKKLSERERQIIVAAQLSADTSAAQIARASGHSAAVVRRVLSSLLEDRILVRKPSLNLSPIGLHEFNVYFSVRPDSSGQRRAFLNDLCTRPRIKWVLETLGPADIVAGVLARSALELHGTIERCIAKHPSLIVGIENSFVRSYTFFGRRYLEPEARVDRYLVAESTDKFVTIDQLDHRILSVLSSDGGLSEEGLSRKVQISPSTLRFRIQRLKSRRIITGFTYQFRDVPPDHSSFHLRLATTGAFSDIHNLLLGFAGKNRSVVYLVQTLGTYQFYLHIDVASALSLGPIVSALRELLGPRIVKYEIVPLVGIARLPTYPFTKFPLEL